MQRMQAENIFHTHIFQAAFTKWMKSVGEHYKLDYDTAEKMLRYQSMHFLSELVKLQQIDESLSVKTITFSVLLSSLAGGEPSILIEAYEDIPFITDPILGQIVKAPWIFYSWNEFVEELKNHTEKQALGGYFRMPEIRSFALKATQSVVENYSTVVKVHLRFLEGTDEWRTLNKDIPFCLSFGFYMEKQYPILGIASNVELIYLQPNESALFARFKEKHFHSQIFKGINLENTVFDHCVFCDVVLHECSLCDARFINCTFENCTFENLSMMGAEFASVRFTTVFFHDIWSSVGQSKQHSDNLSCGDTRFFDCLFEQSVFEHAELTKTLLSNCKFIKVTAIESTLPDSFLS